MLLKFKLKLKVPREASTREAFATPHEDHAPTQHKVPGPSKIRWLDAKIALILNYADVYITVDRNYGSTVSEAFLQFAKREVKTDAINMKLKRALSSKNSTLGATKHTALWVN